MIAKARSLGDAIMVRHTLFSLPWAIAALLLVSGGNPDPITALAVIVVAVGARTAANSLNRLIDEGFDAANPRTAGRELPTGRVSHRGLWGLVAVGGGLAVVATGFLNLLCIVLLPVAAFLVGAYSYTKRFTWLCHYWLGATVALAPLGAFLGVAGHFEVRYFVLAGSVAVWVAGFDILYATQDIAFDRQTGLKSIPARFGARAAFWISRGSHLATLAGLVATGLLWPVGALWWVGVAATALLLAAEHRIARGGTEKHLKVASYGLNEIVGVTMLVTAVAAVYTAGWFPTPAILPPGWVAWASRDMFTIDFWTLRGLLP